MKYIIVGNQISVCDDDFIDINHYTELNQDQIVFYKANPSATISEILNCKLYKPEEITLDEFKASYKNMVDKEVDSIIKSLPVSDVILELTQLVKGVNMMSEQSPLNDYVDNVTSIKSERDKIKSDIDAATTKQQVIDIWNGRTYKY